MDHDEYKAFLKQQYSRQIRPLQSVNDVISAFQKKLDIAETELSESEAIFLKMTILNYINVHKNDPIKSNLDNLNFISYEVVRNEKVIITTIMWGLHLIMKEYLSLLNPS